MGEHGSSVAQKLKETEFLLKWILGAGFILELANLIVFLETSHDFDDEEAENATELSEMQLKRSFGIFVWLNKREALKCLVMKYLDLLNSLLSLGKCVSELDWSNILIPFQSQ